MSYLEPDASDPEHPRHKRLGLIVGIGGMIGGILVAQTCYTQAGVRGSAAGTIPNVMVRAAEEGAELIRRRAPVRIDDVTTLVGATALPNGIVYDLKLSVEVSDQEIATATEALLAGNRNQLCSDPGMREMIAAGMTMTHRYSDVAGRVFSTEVKAC